MASEVEAARKPSLSEEGKSRQNSYDKSIEVHADTEDASETDLAPKLEDGK